MFTPNNSAIIRKLVQFPFQWYAKLGITLTGAVALSNVTTATIGRLTILYSKWLQAHGMVHRRILSRFLIEFGTISVSQLFQSLN